MSERPVINIICGPTASGKTGVAVSLAEKFAVEVVSADSRQMIRHLDVGTAKPTPDECNKVRFHLVDIIEPGERYSAFRFMEQANAAIGEILARGNMPLVVGGTGLYLRALTEGVVEIDENDMEVRSRLEAEMEEFGPEEMHRRLETIDPLEAAGVHPNNKVRIIRALELFYLTGKCKSELVTTGAYKKAEYSFEYHCLLPEREKLYERINGRVDEMMATGLLDEVKTLMARGFGQGLRRARVIGYAELLDHIEKKCSLEEAVSLIKQNTRRYAKRQLTWFRRQMEGEYYESREQMLLVLGKRLAENA